MQITRSNTKAVKLKNNTGLLLIRLKFSNLSIVITKIIDICLSSDMFIKKDDAVKS